MSEIYTATGAKCFTTEALRHKEFTEIVSQKSYFYSVSPWLNIMSMLKHLCYTTLRIRWSKGMAAYGPGYDAVRDYSYLIVSAGFVSAVFIT